MQYFHWKFKSRPEKHDPFPDSAASFTNKNTIRDEAALRFKLLTLSRLTLLALLYGSTMGFGAT